MNALMQKKKMIASQLQLNLTEGGMRDQAFSMNRTKNDDVASIIEDYSDDGSEFNAYTGKSIIKNKGAAPSTDSIYMNQMFRMGKSPN